MKAIQVAIFGSPRLKELAEDQTPLYRISQDPRQCNFTELIATLIGGDTQIEVAEAITAIYPTVQELHRASIHDLMRIRGVGPSKAAKILAAFEIGRQAATGSPTDRPTIHNPADAANLVMYEMGSLEQEHLRVLLLDTRNRVMDIVEIYHGSVNTSQVRVAEVFKPAIQRNAVAIVVVHNHPSGDPSPSPDDVAVTRAVIQAGKLMDIDVLDHLVIGQGRYVSLKERGLAFS
jgi:DNA repair protein RadC